MTCIAGIAHENGVTIGGDSAATSGYDLAVRNDAKVFNNGPYAFGFTSSYRIGQVLRHAFIPPVPDPQDDLHRFMCVEFVDGVRRVLKSAGVSSRENETESGGTFLVGIGGRLFRIEHDYQVAETIHRYDAVGCGASIALGCLFGSSQEFEREVESPESRIIQALCAAERHSAGVRRPFKLVHSRPLQ